MNLSRLEVFREVARTGTFSAAAEALSYTPSAVSQQMHKLEAEVGATLLTRTSRGVRVTEAGELLLARTRRILGEVHAAERELGALAGKRSGSVQLGSFPSASYSLVPDALGIFGQRHPDVTVVLYDGEPFENALRLHERKVELALLFTAVDRPMGTDYYGEWLCPEDAIEPEPLLNERFVLSVPSGHRFASRQVGLDDLRGEVLLGAAHTLGHPELLASCAARGVDIRFDGLISADYVVVRSLVAAGRGIALVPALAAEMPVPGTVEVELAGAPVREVVLARPQGDRLSHAAAALREVLFSVASLRDAAAGEDVRAAVAVSKPAS